MQESDPKRQLRAEIGNTSVTEIAILGIGNPARGDDGFGPAVLDLLPQHVASVVADGGSVPENELPRLAKAKPELVILVDAVHSGDKPGTLRVIGPQELRQDDVSTHSASLAVAAKFLEEACGASCVLLSAQPADCSLGNPMSPAVTEAAQKAADILVDALTERRAEG
ncbi:MAG: hydrogenase 3 maturation endopeptidase HyCI [Planctomycetes bacterium]|nr:hydrogenase 3 maturation endopeptidase HyCI [Planctomycetota bacterium]